MAWNTRSNPTANGPLHLGHIYNILVNEYLAHSTGGCFYVRFDDNSTICTALGERRYDIIEGQIDDINWFDIPVDGYFYQSDQIEEVTKRLNAKGWKRMDDCPDGKHPLPPSVRMGMDWIPYPYVPQQTVERVIHDEMIGINHIIRGDEFLTEYGLYCYLCETLHVPTPNFSFIPRLQSLCGDISKTNGGYTVAEYRSMGYTAKEVRGWIEKACLIYPVGGWELYNIRKNPRLVI